MQEIIDEIKQGGEIDERNIRANLESHLTNFQTAAQELKRLVDDTDRPEEVDEEDNDAQAIIEAQNEIATLTLCIKTLQNFIRRIYQPGEEGGVNEGFSSMEVQGAQRADDNAGEGSSAGRRPVDSQVEHDAQLAAQLQEEEVDLQMQGTEYDCYGSDDGSNTYCDNPEMDANGNPQALSYGISVFNAHLNSDTAQSNSYYDPGQGN